MKVIKLFVAVIGLTVAGFASAASDESTRIAFVNTVQIIEQSPQAAAVRNTLKTEFAPREAMLVEEQNSIKSLEERLVKDGALMSASEKRKLERNIKTKQQSFQSTYKKFAADIESRRKAELQKMQQAIANTVVKVAMEENFDMVLEAGVVYANEKVNITAKVLTALQQSAATPVPAPAQ